MNEESEKISQSSESVQVPVIKMFKIGENEQLIFARYKNYIMIPWFVLSTILNEANEEKIENLVKVSFFSKLVLIEFVFLQARKYGLKPLLIDSTSQPFLSSQLSKFTSPTSPIHLYSIDCVRKILQTFNYHQTTVFDLLDKARLAEANNDTRFWEEAS